MHPINPLEKHAPAEHKKTSLSLNKGNITAERSYDPTLKEDPIHYYDLEK
jgi:hypothetical protein